MSAPTTHQALHKAELRYRPDIDGLRAVAVIPVLLFHLGVPGFAGGFTGVDVFFVISGFLMGSIIHRELEAGSFRISNFYERRIRRIFPAFYAMIIATIVAALFVLLPYSLRILGQSLAASSLVSSNFLFWKTFGYFGPEASNLPLLHTWSLAVEEQFYVLFPVLLILLRKQKTGVRVAALVAFSIASFLLGRHWSTAAPKAAFFLLPARAWELLMGAIPAVLAETRAKRSGAGAVVREAAAAFGLALIVFGMATITERMPFPGVLALIPCTGAALLISAGIGYETAAGKLLSLPPVVWIGKISYSLYLWHLPLIVLTGYYLNRDLTGVEQASLALLSIGLAHVSYRLVETPFRNKHGRFSRTWVFRAAFAAVILSTAAGVAFYATKGLPFRAGPTVAALDLARVNMDHRAVDCPITGPGQLRVCPLNDVPGTPSFMLWADSHGEMIGSSLGKVAAAKGLNGVAAVVPACPPFPGVFRTDSNAPEGCRSADRPKVGDATLEYIRAHNELKTVILVARWGMWAEGSAYGRSKPQGEELADAEAMAGAGQGGFAVFERSLTRTVRDLTALQRRVILLEDVPEPAENVPDGLAKNAFYRRSAHVGVTAGQYRERQKRVREVFARLATLPGVTVIAAESVFCPDEQCVVNDGPKVLYADSDHLTKDGAQRLEPVLEMCLRAAAQ